MVTRKILMTLLLLLSISVTWRTGDAHARTTPASSLVSQHAAALPEIALTFDDGPSPSYTSQILSILSRNGVHATFFVIGLQAQAYPQLVQQEFAAGHAIGDHTWNHPNLVLLSAAQIRWQLDSTAHVIQQETGVRPTFMRPPYGSMNAFVRSQIIQDGFTPVLWTINTVDWLQPDSSIIVQRVISQARNGAIVLMHDGGGNRSQTVAALPRIITTLSQRGFRFVTIQQLFAGT